jgi:putative addiction module killer protein
MIPSQSWKFVCKSVTYWIQFGPGYRLYYTIRNRKLILMLCGGDKSTQKSDIAKAKEIASQID